MEQTTQSPYNVGDKVIAFDADRWFKTGDIGDNSIFNLNATIIAVSQTEYGEWLADVLLENGKESKSHFQDALKPCE